MELVNQSRLEVGFKSASPDLVPDLVVGQVVGKVMGQWDLRGRFSLCWDAKPLLFDEMQETPFGMVPSDFHHLKSGCDLCALGRVYSDESKGSEIQDIQLQVGAMRRSLRVFGRRHWERRGQELVSSPPLPFRMLDLGWSHSFGGVGQDAQGQPSPYLFNPEGTGYQLCEQQALGAALPRVEDPESLIQRWDDRPCPISLAPIPRELPLQLYPDPPAYVDELLRKGTMKLPAHYHNHGHPNFRVTQVQPGTRLSLAGMSPGAALRGYVPQERFFVRCRLGDRVHEREMMPTSITFFPEARWLSVTYSAHVAFRWVPKERRSIQVLEQPAALQGVAL